MTVSGPKPALCGVSATNGLGNYFGVARFVFNSIDAVSSSSFDDGANYINRACTFSTTVTAGSSYTALVKGYYTNTHRCRVYIDFNNNGNFDDPGETVLTGTGNSVTATVPIATTTVQNVPLRVRVVADASASVSPCLLPGSSGFGSGQAEDFSLTIVPASVSVPAPTVPVLTASATSVCGATVVSLIVSNCNATVNWSGGLGNGTTKSVMTDVTTTYSVSCVQTGGVSTTASVLVTVRPGPVPSVCSVSATNGLSSIYGVERVIFGTIDAGSASSFSDGANYVNLACDVSTTLTAGLSYSALVKCVGTLAHQARMYVDYNNNGVFTDPGETVLTGVGSTVSATVQIPVTAITNTLLRVRVVADALLGSGIGPCLVPGSGANGSGQAEDYSLLILPAPPCPGMATTKAGTWNDATVWSCNRLPTATDDIFINHALTLPVGGQANARRMTFGSNGRLIYGTNARIMLNP